MIVVDGAEDCEQETGSDAEEDAIRPFAIFSNEAKTIDDYLRSYVKLGWFAEEDLRQLAIENDKVSFED